MNSDPEQIFGAIDGMRDGALMLRFGNAFLCEEPLLKKIGLIIESSTQKLKGDIVTLKEKFPGKFVHDVETNEILDKIHNTAQELKNPDQELNEKCMVGALGEELETDVKALTQAVRTIRDQVEGEALTYTKKDSLLNLMGDIRETGRPFEEKIRLTLKILLWLILVSILPFSFLFLTMENEKDFLKKIAQEDVFIRSQQAVLSKIDREKEEISEKMESMEEKPLSRLGKLEVMKLNVKIHKLDEKRRDVETEIGLHEKNIRDNQKKIGDLKRIPFIKRLLRQ